jgi:lipoyl(octanoyl) transferase
VNTKQIQLIETGLSGYDDIYHLQKQLFQEVSENRSAHYLILTQHRPVITIGQKSNPAHVLVQEKFLKEQGVELFHTDRGGDVTFHGPGQLVGYPILNLLEFKQDVNWYLRCLEEVILRTLADFRLRAGRIEHLTGVWIGTKKICAIGVKVTRWVTMHGFALNVSTNLDYFQYIIPCGISGKGVTSVFEQLGNIADLNDVSTKVKVHFQEVFGTELVRIGNDITKATAAG